MEPILFISFLLTSAILIVIPGPNVGLIVSNSLRFGSGAGLATVTGTTLGIALQLGVVCLGMTSLLALLANWFEWVRWIGVAYLLYLGARHFRATQETTGEKPSRFAGGRHVAEGLVIALSNPKTLVFFAAFLPQFISANHPYGRQLALLGLTFTLMAFCLDSCYALLAGRLQVAVENRGHHSIFRKVNGIILIGAGIGLGLARRN